VSPSHSSLKDATIVCLSHLRWNFVYQRPQHLLSRMAKEREVLYVEEPVPTEGPPRMEVRRVALNVQVAVPHLPHAECTPGHPGGEARQRLLLDGLLRDHRVERPVLWYYTPMSLGFSDHVPARLVVYDCMDELANFDNAPAALVPREQALLLKADLVFTGSYSLFEAKRRAHPHVHAFPSSVDLHHFAQARSVTEDPQDMAHLPHPRIGFYGVLDERLDTGLLDAAAQARPDWHWVLVGPVVKIDPATLPRRPNLHYLGSKRYEELPGYLGRWDVAMMPFAINASTRFISPTKTPEYLGGGCPVVSTPITDVVNDYGRSGLVRIAHGAAAFVRAVQDTLDGVPARSAAFCQRADVVLHGLSWDRTCSEMLALMADRLAPKDTPPPRASRRPTPIVHPAQSNALTAA
jgi:UDP-galactopyranose mutase